MSGKFIILFCAAALILSGVECFGNEPVDVGTIENKTDAPDISNLPKSIYVVGQVQHVQGIAYDRAADCIYMSFTSRFLKVDRDGNIIGSIDRIQGHLGAMTFDPVGRKVYASLECKDDEIGRGIAKTLDVEVVSEPVFYIAIIDVDALNEPGADPEDGRVLRTVCVREACEDYAARIPVRGPAEVVEHRYACSGIDGVTIAPEIGSRQKALSEAKKRYLYVAYGIYGDLDRTDNDYQVILQYDLASLERYSRPVVFGTVHRSGPSKPRYKYFLFTGNTTWGVQNLVYDEFTGNFLVAVYKGKKPQYPNWDLYCFSLSQKPFRAALSGVPYQKGTVRQLSLNPELGQKDSSTGIRGWRFRWGSTGLNSIGGGLWYVSESGRDKTTKLYHCDATLYRWTGGAERPFESCR